MVKSNFLEAEVNNTSPAVKLPVDHDSTILVNSIANVIRSLKLVILRKVPGPDSIHAHILKTCASQLAEVLTDLFNLFLSLSVIPTCFKKITIVPVTRTFALTCLNDYHPVAPFKSWMLWAAQIDPQTMLLLWQCTKTVSTGAPQGRVLSPLLHSLFTYDCVARYSSNIIFIFADDTTGASSPMVMSQSTERKSGPYHSGAMTVISVSTPAKQRKWLCTTGTNRRLGMPPYTSMELRAKESAALSFLVCTSTDLVTWPGFCFTNKVVKSACRRLYFLRRPRRFCLIPKILTNFYKCTTESILIGYVTGWYSRVGSLISH